MGLKKSERGEDVRMCNILDVGKVEHVMVVADLELGLSLLVCGDHFGK